MAPARGSGDASLGSNATSVCVAISEPPISLSQVGLRSASVGRPLQDVAPATGISVLPDRAGRRVDLEVIHIQPRRQLGPGVRIERHDSRGPGRLQDRVRHNARLVLGHDH